MSNNRVGTLRNNIEMMYWIKRKMWQIKNLIKWFPIIWNQYDFDDSYAIEVFMFQLNKIADFMDSDKAYTVSAKSKASSIRRLTKLMKDVYDEKFLMEYHDKFKEKYGEVRILFPLIRGTQFYEMKEEFPQIEGMTEKQLQEEYLRMMKESMAKQEKAHTLVWKLVNNYIRGWWD